MSLMLVGLAGSQAQTGRSGEVGTTTLAPEGILEPLYRATGVTDSAAVATVVHCTNLGTSAGFITIEITEFNGTLDCQVFGLQVGPDRTATIGTHFTQVYSEDTVCSEAPGTNQGSIVIFADPVGSTDFICTIQVLDSQASPPDFVLTLDLYDGDGNLVGDPDVFADGFESGDSTAWTQTIP